MIVMLLLMLKYYLEPYKLYNTGISENKKSRSNIIITFWYLKLYLDLLLH